MIAIIIYAKKLYVQKVVAGVPKQSRTEPVKAYCPRIREVHLDKFRESITSFSHSRGK